MTKFISAVAIVMLSFHSATAIAQVENGKGAKREGHVDSPSADGSSAKQSSAQRDDDKAIVKGKLAQYTLVLTQAQQQKGKKEKGIFEMMITPRNKKGLLKLAHKLRQSGAMRILRPDPNVHCHIKTITPDPSIHYHIKKIPGGPIERLRLYGRRILPRWKR